MTPGTYDLDLYRGDTYGWRFILWQDVAQTIPVDLTGSTAKAEVRSQPGGALAASMTCVVTLPNFIDATLPNSESVKLPEKGSWDLQVTFPGGRVNTVLKGDVIATPDVTDSSHGGRW